MKYFGKTIDLTKYYLAYVDSNRNYLFEYEAIKPENCASRNNHNVFYFKRNVYSKDLHIGDFLATIIGKKIGFKVCDTEIYKAPLLKEGVFDEGILSYVSLAEDDSSLLPENIIKEYLESKNEIFNTPVDIDTVFQAAFYYMNKKARPYQEFLNFKQDFINMLVYDAKFMIPDRSLDDWYFRENRSSGAVDLYPMFDNEMILGFERKAEKLKPGSITEELIEEIDNDHTLKIVTPLDKLKGKRESDYHDVIKYLLEKYPKQTTKALQDTKKITVQNLAEELDEIEGMFPSRKELTLKLFGKRDREIERIYEEYNKDEKAKY